MTQSIIVFYENLDNDLNLMKTPFALAETREDAILFCKHNLLFTWASTLANEFAGVEPLPYIVINPDQLSYHIRWRPAPTGA